MRVPMRTLGLSLVAALLLAMVALPAVAQDDVDYPLGEEIDQVDEVPGGEIPTDVETDESADVEGVTLTRDAGAQDEDPQVLGTSLALTGGSTLLLVAAGLVLALLGGGALVATRRRRATAGV